MASLNCIGQIQLASKLQFDGGYEHLIQSPVIFDWSLNGKMLIVQISDYPADQRCGVVCCLEDTNNDSIFDKSTAFLTGLNFPNGICLWGKGVIISAASEVFYAEDTDGDSKADFHKTLFTGFFPGNPQHRVNGFEYGLDNWFYGANGDSGGIIHPTGSHKAINIGGRDFRFRPDTGEFETEAGPTQFGRHRDDWGNWFGNNNSAWLWHYYLPIRYLSRNPYLQITSTLQKTAQYPDSDRVFTTSHPTRYSGNTDDRVTSACSAMPYRDELFGPEFENSVFICDPANNLVHREVLEPDGVSFKSHRAPVEKKSEFLTSTDTWFRPVSVKTGPDGALYVLDMHRAVIEHPEYIPREKQKGLDFRAGADMGRLYRIYPKGAKLRLIPRLDKMSTAELVAALDSSNGWQRDTAQRLLFEKQDKSAVEPLKRMIATSARAKARLQALCTLDGLNAATPNILIVALNDSNHYVREHAVRISEPLLRNGDFESALAEKLLNLADDPEIRVRYQLAFSLGEWSDVRAGMALAKIALHDPNYSPIQIAVMSSATNHLNELLSGILTTNPPAETLDHLVVLALAMNNTNALETALVNIARPDLKKIEPWQMAGLSGFLNGLERRGSNFKKFSATHAGLTNQLGELERVMDYARHLALDASAPESDRILAIRLFGHGLPREDDDAKRLATLLLPLTPSKVQQAAVAALNRNVWPGVAEILLSNWKNYLPETRGAVIDSMLNRVEWMEALLDTVEKGKVLASQIGAFYQQKLLGTVMPDVRKRAEKLFSATTPDRKKLAEDYRSVSGLKGDSRHGAELFRQNCALCHELNGIGFEVGPNLGSVANKPFETLIVAILDPNQSIDPRYQSYTAVTRAGEEISGIVTTDTDTSITLRKPGGVNEMILRADLDQLKTSSVSLMPEGFEKALDQQGMADLIAFIRQGNK